MKRDHTCKYTTIACKKCKKLLIQKDLPCHLETSCSLAKECKCCGLPGTVKAITFHEANCAIENCKSCDEIFRTDKLAQHQSFCSQRDFECVVEGCTEKMSFDALKTHFITDHPILVDTGIFYKKENSLFLVIDSKHLSCIGRKIDENEEMIKFNYMGWNSKYDEWVLKSSSRICSLENKVDEILSYRPWSIFPKIFLKGKLGSLIKNNLLSHKDVELLCYLERAYKYTKNKNDGDSDEEEKKEYGE